MVKMFFIKILKRKHLKNLVDGEDIQNILSAEYPQAVFNGDCRKR